MKKLVCLILVAIMMAMASPVLAEDISRKELKSHFLLQAQQERLHHRVGDWFATVGKSDQEKALIRAHRRSVRAAKRSRKQMQATARRAEKLARQQAQAARRRAR